MALAVSQVTSYDVAKLAGVSQSAVSRCFRPGGSASAAVRARVAEAARSLGYAPSNAARALTTRRSRTVGVLLTDSVVAYYPDVLLNLGRAIQAAGSRTLLFSVPSEAEAATTLDDILGYQVDGLVSAVGLTRGMCAALARRGVPVVFYNRAPQGPGTGAVGVDHAAAMAALADHLVGIGRRTVAFLAGPPGALVSEARLQTLRTALAERGGTVATVVRADYSYRGGRAALPALLLPGMPDAICCANDTMALGVLDACRHDGGPPVPRTVAVTGFDDIEQAGWPSYDLTTLRQPAAAMAESAVELLSNPGGTERQVAATLVVRGSTQPAT